MHYHQFLFSVMCKGSYHLNEEGTNRRNRVVFPPSAPSSPTNPVSSPSSPISQREISTTFFSSPRSQGRRSSTPRFSFSSRRSQGFLEPRSTVKDEGSRKSGGSTPSRLFLPQLKRGKLKRRVTIGSSTSSGGTADVDEPDWPPYADEDYIVFCFEEDGAFHVVLEESPKTLTEKLQCEDHGNVTCACTGENKDVNHLRPIRRDCFLTNKEIEEEEELRRSSKLSPELHQNRVQSTEDSDLLEKDKLVIRDEYTESMECRNGSIESTDSSSLDWEEQLHDETNPEVVGTLFSLDDEDDNDNIGSPDFRRDCLLPNNLVDEEDIFLSPKSQLGKQMTIDELLLGGDDRFSSGSDQSSGFSGSDDKVDQEDQDQPEENEEMGSESPKSSISNQSDTSSSSFQFPVLEFELSGSPVTWPKSGRFHIRKHKSRRLSIRCCRF